MRSALDVPWAVAKKLCQRGKVLVNGAPITDPGHRVAAGSEVTVRPEAPSAARAESPSRRRRGEPCMSDSRRRKRLVPWAIVLDQISLFGFAAMAVFLGILVIGFIYEWKKGALEWE